MLDTLSLDNKIEKADYRTQLPPLVNELGKLQRTAREMKVPVIIVFEGWDAAGKGTIINKVIQTLDPRGFQVYPTNAPNEEEKLRPFLWRFWINTPAKGRISVYDRSWYGHVSIDRIDGRLKAGGVKSAFQEIRNFEKQWTDDGGIMIKIFLHIDKKEQKRRFKRLESRKSMSWKVTREDWKHHEQYKTYLDIYDEMINETDTKFAPWTLIASQDKRFAIIKAFHTIIQFLRGHIKAREAGRVPDITIKPDTADIPAVLDTLDMGLRMDRTEYKEQLEYYQKKLRKLEHKIYTERRPVIIAYEGSDAGGKGGSIRRLASRLDPRGYDVIPIAAPTPTELSHHYLWRFWKEFPKAGHIAVFDRTWYGRVLVERVEEFAREHEWKRAYREINEMEASWTNFGAIIVKFWLQVSPEEQLKRFQARQEDPDKQWKITEEDWRNREKWSLYRMAVDEMIYRTSTLHAPWTLIEADNKYFARIKALKTVCQTIKNAL